MNKIRISVPGDLHQPSQVIGMADGDRAVSTRRVIFTPSMSERLLLLEEGHCLRDHALYACSASNRGSSLGVEATSLLTLVQMVESGVGIGLVPEMAVRGGLTQSPYLVARPIAKPSPKRTIALVARPSTPRLADLKALGEVITKVSASAARVTKV